VIAAPLFTISDPKLVIAQCKAGVVGSFPALNARPASQLDEWLHEITETLSSYDKSHPERPSAPFAVNQIVHRTNDRLEQDMSIVEKWKVPLVITSLGARVEINAAVHSYGGLVLHDVINNSFAHKAVEKGADGLIAVAAGAGGHAGQISPFALMQEIRRWFEGLLALSGAIASGGAILAAQAIGADFAYIGTPFIATKESRVADGYKLAIVDGSSADIVGTSLFTGVFGNYLKASIVNSRIDPEDLPVANLKSIDFQRATMGGPKPWKDIWGSGQGIAAVTEVVSVEKLVARLSEEYEAATRMLCDCR
jgi:nitronate monooxygenase